MTRPGSWAGLALAVALAAAGCGGGEEKAAAQVATGKALVAEGKYEAAAAALKQATEADKNSLEAWLQLGHAYAGLKKYDEALAAYVTAKRVDRRAVSPYLAHAKVQIELGRIAPAILELTLVTEMEPKNLEALKTLGKISQLPHPQPDGSTGVTKADLERAELNLEAAAALAPQDAEVQLDLAKAQAKLGKHEAALAALKKLQERAATDAAAKALLPEIEQALKLAN
jgi:tetratricopeptide (TPR) repeat protein